MGEQKVVPSARSIPLQHETSEEGRKVRIGIERENMRDILVGPHNDHAAAFPIDATHAEDVAATFQVRAEHFLVVAKPVTALPGKKESGHVLEAKLPMALLEDGAYIDHRVDIRPLRRIPPNR